MECKRSAFHLKTIVYRWRYADSCDPQRMIHNGVLNEAWSAKDVFTKAKGEAVGFLIKWLFLRIIIWITIAGLLMQRNTGSPLSQKQHGLWPQLWTVCFSIFTLVNFKGVACRWEFIPEKRGLQNWKKPSDQPVTWYRFSCWLLSEPFLLPSTGIYPALQEWCSVRKNLQTADHRVAVLMPLLSKKNSCWGEKLRLPV